MSVGQQSLAQSSDSILRVSPQLAGSDLDLCCSLRSEFRTRYEQELSGMALPPRAAATVSPPPPGPAAAPAAVTKPGSEELLTSALEIGRSVAQRGGAPAVEKFATLMKEQGLSEEHADKLKNQLLA